MNPAHAFALFLGALLTSAALAAPQHERIDDASPLRHERFESVTPAQFESASFRSSRGTLLPYRLLRPSRWREGERYPLVLQLHGSGGVGSDNLAQLEPLAKSWAMPDVRERYQAFVLIPQFPMRSANYGPIAPERFAEPSPALNDAVELVAAFAAAHAVDPSRVYASGFSMGASSTWLLPTLAPGVFAGIVPVGGVAPANDQAAKFRQLPVLVLHGDADGVNPITADRRFVKALAEVGARAVKLREYQGLQHQPPADAYPGLWWRDWLFSQRLQP